MPFVADISLVDAFVYQNPPIRVRSRFQIWKSVLLSPPLFVGSTNAKPSVVGGCRGYVQRMDTGEQKVDGGTVLSLMISSCEGLKSLFINMKADLGGDR